MIDKIHIHALKSISDLTVNCAKINLIVGTNSSGKSTFLQALLLDAQYTELSDNQGLNGPLVSVGEYREARNYNMPKDNIIIELWGENKKEPARIEFKENNDTYEMITSEAADPILNISDDDVFEHLIWGTNAHYVSCHRIGVEDVYLKRRYGNDAFGIDGEYALAYLLEHQTDEIDAKFIKDATVGVTLLPQVNYWLSKILKTTLHITDLKKTNYLQVIYNNNPKNKSETLFCRPVNIGAGVSYLISILITCLGSEENSCVIIENPEIHLHPKAQSELCEFFYHIGLAGVQLFIESHSDHVFNGMRVGIASKEFEENAIAINFFALDKEKFTTCCNPIKIGRFGKIIGTNSEMEIDDLFDQFEIDIDRMLGI